jgi:hypothetical protein
VFLEELDPATFVLECQGLECPRLELQMMMRSLMSWWALSPPSQVNWFEPSWRVAQLGLVDFHQLRLQESDEGVPLVLEEQEETQAVVPGSHQVRLLVHEWKAS